MGFNPRVVDTMTLWEINVCWRAWKMRNVPEDSKDSAPTPAEYYDMLKRLG